MTPVTPPPFGLGEKKSSAGKKRQVPWLDLGRQPESSLA